MVNPIRAIKYAVGKSITTLGSWARPSSSVFFGNSGSGGSANDSVWAIGGIEAIAQAIGSLDIKFKNERDGKPIDRPSADQLQWMRLMMNPNPLMASRQFFELLAMKYDLQGLCYWIPMDLNGNPLSDLMEIPAFYMSYGPDKVKPRISGGKIIGFTLSESTRSIDLSPMQVVRFWKTNPSSYADGLKLDDKIKSTLELDKGARKVNKGFFDRGARPSGIITADSNVPEPEFKKFVNLFAEQYGSQGNAGKIAGLPHPMKFQAAENTKDMDFQNLHTLTRDEIFGAHRAPKHYFGVNDNINYATAEVIDRVFWLGVVKPKASVFEEIINTRILMGTGIQLEFSYDRIPIIAKDELTVKKEKLALGARLFNLGYPTNWINKVLGLGMDEIKESWANEPHDPTLSTQLIAGDNAPTEPTKGIQKKNSADDQIEKSISLSLSSLTRSDTTEFEILDRARSGDAGAMRTYCEIVERATIAQLQPGFKTKMESYMKRLMNSQIARINAYVEGKPFIGKADGEREITIDSVSTILFDKHKWDGIIIENSDAYHLKAYKNGIARAEKEMGIVYQQSDEQSVLGARRAGAKITRVNETIRDNVNKAIIEKVKAGANTAEVVQAVQDAFDTSLARANLIARQELGNAANAGRWDAMSEAIEEKMWLDAGDSNVRESHQRFARMGSQPMDFEYASGLKYPQDHNCNDGGQVINCRCVLVSGKRE